MSSICSNIQIISSWFSLLGAGFLLVPAWRASKLLRESSLLNELIAQKKASQPKQTTEETAEALEKAVLGWATLLNKSLVQNNNSLVKQSMGNVSEALEKNAVEWAGLLKKLIAGDKVSRFEQAIDGVAEELEQRAVEWTIITHIQLAAGITLTIIGILISLYCAYHSV